MIDTISDCQERLSVLHVLGPLSPRGWLERALDEGAGSGIQVTPAPALTVALEYLRERPYDVVALDQEASDHPPTDLLTALFTASDEHQAIVVLAEGEDRSAAADYLLAGAQAYVCLRQTTTREFVLQLQAAAAHGRCRRENQRLQAWQNKTREGQQQEVLGLLQEQLTRFTWAARRTEPLPLARATWSDGARPWSTAHRELLQAYLMMGCGQLAEEVERLVDRLHAAGESLPAAMLALTEAMQELVRDRAPRSARHVVHRGNLLLFDLVLAWTDRLTARTTHDDLDRRSRL